MFEAPLPVLQAMNQESGIDNVLVLDASFDHPSFDQQSKCL
jgi:hypothetical protein